MPVALAISAADHDRCGSIIKQSTRMRAGGGAPELSSWASRGSYPSETTPTLRKKESATACGSSLESGGAARSRRRTKGTGGRPPGKGMTLSTPRRRSAVGHARTLQVGLSGDVRPLADYAALEDRVGAHHRAP